MTDLDPCLAGCDAALAEAQALLAMLDGAGLDEAAIAPVRGSIARLRREIDRLRGLKVAPAPRQSDPWWIELGGGGESPWSAKL